MYIILNISNYYNLYGTYNSKHYTVIILKTTITITRTKKKKRNTYINCLILHFKIGNIKLDKIYLCTI